MFWWLAQHLATTALLMVVVVMVCRLTPRRPALHHALWLVVLIKFLVPPLVAWPWTVSDMSHMLALDSVAKDLFSQTPRAAVDGASISSSQIAPATAELAWRYLARAAISVWLLGAVVVGLKQFRSIRRHARLIRRADSGPDYLRVKVHHIAAAMGVRPVPVVVARGISSPFIWCLGRLQLVWPAGLAGRDEMEQLDPVIAHELAHVRRRDHWTAWLELLAGIVWWWNPLFWFARRQRHESAEMTCDALAISLLPEERRAFADALLKLCSMPAAEPLPALGVRSAGRSAFERRLKMMMSSDIVSRLSWRGLAAVALMGVLTIPTWTTGEEPNGKPTPAKTEKSLYSWSMAFADKQDAAVGFYLAESTAGEGLKKAKIGDEAIFLHAEPVLTGQDVAQAKLVKNEANETEIEVMFTKAGEEKISKASAANIGKRLAIVVNGTVVSAPTIRSPIGDRGQISGRFSDADWEKIAKSLQSKN